MDVGDGRLKRLPYDEGLNARARGKFGIHGLLCKTLFNGTGIVGDFGFSTSFFDKMQSIVKSVGGLLVFKLFSGIFSAFHDGNWPQTPFNFHNHF